jgi:diguanylate cyclase (GGDEF)-like protein
MDFKSETLDVHSFTLESSSEVKNVVKEVLTKAHDRVLVHIVAFIHNTVLVQNLKKELEKNIDNIEIVLLKHDNKQEAKLVLFNLKTKEEELTCNEALQEIFLDNVEKNKMIESYRTQLFERYFRDNLTNLPNLYQLRRDLQNDEEEFGIILVNIDNFQTINNFYGFVVGDYVLEYVGNHLKELLEGYKVYRLSGAEYAILTTKNLGFYELKEFLENLYQKLQTIELIYQETKIFVNFTLASSAKHDISNVFSKVSMALIYAKQNNLPFWIYENRMKFENEYARNLKLSALVRDAVEKEKIFPYFQAIFDNRTQEVVKYECLARLKDENDKILAPDLFIPIAKKIKVYHNITKQMINKSFEIFEKLEYDFTINIAIEDIVNGDMFSFIVEKLKNSPVSSRVTFELLESEAIKDFKKVDRFINEIVRYGAKIAIDDFGSGYSNFSYLTKLQVDYIKIDGSLIENIDVDETSSLVVETIVDFAKRLGVQTVAEYVHSSVVMDKVKSLGIDYSQGFYIDMPSPKVKKEEV